MTNCAPSVPRSTPTTERMWQAVVERDATLDDHFYYGVSTTGVFCRPSCCSRRPLQGNVTFYESPAHARAAGFRACKRCLPKGPQAAEQRATQVERLCRLIESSEASLSIKELATHIGASESHTHRIFKAATGVTPRQYAAECRRQRISGDLIQSKTVTEAIYASGFGSSSSFYSAAKNVLGMKPERYRDGGAREAIRFALAESSLGAVLVASTARGLCAIALGDDPQLLLDELRAQFPQAELMGADSDFDAMVASVVSLVEHPATAAKLPLDIRGTAFQQRVWAALSKIPPGTTVSYSELARKVGSPSATRAVASACAANRLAVALPCHRVVRQDGGLSGYRWGVQRKAELQKREREG